MQAGASLGTSAARAFIVGRLAGTLEAAHASPSQIALDTALAAELFIGPTGGRVSNVPIPEFVTLPAIGLSRYGAGTSSAPIGSNVASVTSGMRMLVRAICEGYSSSPIERAADIINQLLDGREALVDLGGALGSFSVDCTRESELLTDLPAEDDGTVYQHMGGIYAFFISRVA